MQNGNRNSIAPTSAGRWERTQEPTQFALDPIAVFRDNSPQSPVLGTLSSEGVQSWQVKDA